MTSHPQDMTKSMIDALGRSSNIVTHLHLPIQSVPLLPHTNSRESTSTQSSSASRAW